MLTVFRRPLIYFALGEIIILKEGYILTILKVSLPSTSQNPIFI